MSVYVPFGKEIASNKNYNKVHGTKSHLVLSMVDELGHNCFVVSAIVPFNLCPSESKVLIVQFLLSLVPRLKGEGLSLGTRLSSCYALQYFIRGGRISHPLSSSFTPNILLTSAILLPTPKASCPLSCHLKNHDSVWSNAHFSFSGQWTFPYWAHKIIISHSVYTLCYPQVPTHAWELSRDEAIASVYQLLCVGRN